MYTNSSKYAFLEPFDPQEYTHARTHARTLSFACTDVDPLCDGPWAYTIDELFVVVHYCSALVRLPQYVLHRLQYRMVMVRMSNVKRRAVVFCRCLPWLILRGSNDITGVTRCPGHISGHPRACVISTSDRRYGMSASDRGYNIFLSAIGASLSSQAIDVT